MPLPDPLPVYIADSDPIYLDGLGRRLSESPDHVCLGRAKDGEQAYRDLSRIGRDCVALVDVTLDRLDGLDVLQRLRNDGITRKDLPVVLIGHTSDNGIHRAIKLDSAGYLLKRVEWQEVASCLEQAARGQYVFHPDVMASLTKSEETLVLSERETTILRMLAEGASRATIAQALNIAPSTVKTHLDKLYRRWGVSSATAAVAKAMRQGFLR